MSSIKRALDGDVLVYRLSRDALTIDAGLVAKHGRSVRSAIAKIPFADDKKPAQK